MKVAILEEKNVYNSMAAVTNLHSNAFPQFSKIRPFSKTVSIF